MNGATSGAPFTNTRIRPAQRIWLGAEGVPVFGIGIRELLMGVESTGSLRQAASNMGLSYSKAWHIVRRAEEHLGFTLLMRQTGGASGGGSTVSNEGKWLVGAFGALVDEADTALDELYLKHFGSWHDVRGAATIEETPGPHPGRRADRRAGVRAL